MFELLVGLAAIVAFFLALNSRNRIAPLEQRIVDLERQLARRTGDAAMAPAHQPPPPAPVEESVSPAPPADRMGEPGSAAIVAAAPRPEAPPPLPVEPATPGRSFEERFGASWVVWIGGVALALGGIFLVQYSIEQGLIGPGVRVFLGALLASILIAAGEWARRKEIVASFGGIPSANIPSILTAAGTTVAYAVVYAAYALYGFLDPPAAFVLLGIVALATLAAALLHGPALAALGQIGAFVAPLLVATATPSYWALHIYLTIVTAASLALARVRLWRWLVVTAIAFATLWIFPGITDMRVDALTPKAFYVVAGFALSAALIVSGLFYGPRAERGEIDPVSSLALGAYLFAATALVLARQHDGLTLIVFTALVAATVAITWRTEATALAMSAASLFAALVMADWAVDMQIDNLVAPGGPVAGAIPERATSGYGLHLALGGAFATLFGAIGFLAQGRHDQAGASIRWAAVAVFTPLAMLIALYYCVAGFTQSVPFAALAMLLAGLFAVATEALTRREPRPGLPSAAAIFATGAVAALALTLTFALEKGWLTVALALMVPGVAWVADKRPLPWLRWLAAALTVLVMARVGYEPRIVGDNVGTTLVFNWLLYGYGVPALAFWLAGWLLRHRADDQPARMVDSAAILFTVLTAFLQIRHYVNNGNVYAAQADLAEIALQVCGGLAFAIGLERLRARTGSIVHDGAALIIAALSLVAIVLGLVLIENPLFNATPVGGPFVNLILLAYGLPALLAAALGLVTRSTRPQAYRAVAAVTAVGLALLYLSLQVTRIYHGPVLSQGPFTSPEGYTYSAVWLAFGVVLLIIGIGLRSQPVRLCSAAVVLLTVAKVFLFDMSGLTGVWRAFSFIGLGLVLVGIGYLYQRLLFTRRPPSTAAASPTSA